MRKPTIGCFKEDISGSSQHKWYAIIFGDSDLQQEVMRGRACNSLEAAMDSLLGETCLMIFSCHEKHDIARRILRR